MSVTIAVPGKFQGAYHFARYLERLDRLERLITSLPYARGASFGVSRERTRSLAPLAYWYHGFERWGPPRLKPLNQLAYSVTFDRLAARMLGDAAVFNGWSTVALHAQRAARRAGMRTLLQTGSTHIEWQTEILRAEFSRWSPDAPLTHPRLIVRTLREYEEADAIVTCSSFARQTFLDRGHDPARVHCVPWVVKPPSSPPPQERPQRERPRILHVGHISVRKGIPYLLDAFRRLRTPAELRLIGPYDERLIERVGGLPDHVTLLGRQAAAAVEREYRDADIFVLASVEEGSALVVWEAMGAALPIVVTDRAGADQVMHGHSGLVVPAGDAPALAQALQRLVEAADERVEMGRQAAEAFAARDPEAFGAEMAALAFGGSS